MVERNLRYTKHGDQQTNHRAEQCRSLSQFPNLNNQIGTITKGEIVRDDIRHSAANPTSYG